MFKSRYIVIQDWNVAKTRTGRSIDARTANEMSFFVVNNNNLRDECVCCFSLHNKIDIYQRIIQIPDRHANITASINSHNMPPSAPIPQHQQATERDGVVASSPSQEYRDNDDDKWNRSKGVISTGNDEIMNRELPLQQKPAVAAAASLAAPNSSPSNPTITTTAPQQQQQQQQQPPIPVDTGLWNPNSMLGMNPYNTFNPMIPSTSVYGNYGGLNNNNMNHSMMTMMMPPPLPMVGGGGGPFSSITNYLLGIQNVILSIGQVVQIISFNASSLQQLCESILAMFEHAVKSWQEQQQQHLLVNETVTTTEEQQRVKRQQQRRLRALRYTITMAMSYIGYTIIRKLFFDQRRRQRYLSESELSQLYHNNNVTVPYHPTTNTYWNPPPPPQQHPSPPYHPYYYNTGSFQ